VPDSFRTILGVQFFVGALDDLLERVPNGGLIVVPSAPVMTRLADDPAHRAAMEGADLAVTDSAFMVLLWLALTGERIRRISGLRFLRGLLDTGEYRRKGDTFWVMPSAEDSAANVAWLRSQGLEIGEEDTYVAPLYPREGVIVDPRLVATIEARRPSLVFIALSGGVQERLGWDLRQKLAFRPSLLCIGGAIAFLSGQQNRIPAWADRLALGWALRFIAAPRLFAGKLRGVQRLAPLLREFGPRPVRPGGA
jgi:N-acetylglucosaminyldiphosphoundecaprenol N-acetyl-beta-D-mannosaminyltransferase